jgi:diguanylate cyclase (GGDEF)-like protein/PAS domain S-box-containing protein
MSNGADLMGSDGPPQKVGNETGYALAYHLGELSPSLEDPGTLRDFVEKISEAIYITTPDGTILDGNPAFLELFGADSLEELQELKAHDLLVNPERRIEEARLLEAHGRVVNFEFKIRRLDGEIRTVRDIVYARRDENGKTVAFHGILVDVTESRVAEEALRRSEAKYRTIFENVQDIFVRTDFDGTLLDVSPSVERHLGYKSEDLLGSKFESIFVSPADREMLRDALISEGEVTDYEVEIRAQDGHLLTVSFNGQVVLDEDGAPSGFEGSLRDITERKQLELQLEELSVRDPLTGCYNRRYLDRIRNELERPTSTWGCLLLDLDNFKRINDTYGHEEGDRVLKGIAHFVNRHGRAEDVLVRLGGDEFALLVQAASLGELETIAERILEVAPFESPAAFSLGFAFRHPGDTVDQVISRADRAMYAAKGRGVKRPPESE